MTKITYENMADKLVEALPELRPEYEAELEYWGDEKPGRHVTYGNILNPHIESALESHDEDFLRRAFSFLEELANHDDEKVQEVVGVTVCEGLIGNKKLLPAAKSYMGEATLRICREIEEWKPGNRKA